MLHWIWKPLRESVHISIKVIIPSEAGVFLFQFFAKDLLVAALRDTSALQGYTLGIYIVHYCVIVDTVVDYNQIHSLLYCKMQTPRPVHLQCIL